MPHCIHTMTPQASLTFFPNKAMYYNHVLLQLDNKNMFKLKSKRHTVTASHIEHPKIGINSNQLVMVM